MIEDTIDTEGICSLATIESYESNLTEYMSLRKSYNKSIIDEINEHDANQIKMYENFSVTLSLEFYHDFIAWFIIGILVTSLFNIIVLLSIFRSRYSSNKSLENNQVSADTNIKISKVFPESATETKSTGNMKESKVRSTTNTETGTSKSFDSTTKTSMKGDSNTGNLKVCTESKSIAPHAVKDANKLDGRAKESRG